MNLKEYYEVANCGTRVFDKNGKEIRITILTKCENYEVVSLRAVEDDLIFVEVKEDDD